MIGWRLRHSLLSDVMLRPCKLPICTEVNCHFSFAIVFAWLIIHGYQNILSHPSFALAHQWLQYKLLDLESQPATHLVPNIWTPSSRIIRIQDVESIRSQQTIYLMDEELTTPNLAGGLCFHHLVDHPPHDGDETQVRFLLQNGGDVHVNNEDRQTPLLLAAKRGHSDLVRLLLKHGADIDSADKDGSKAGDVLIVQLLLEGDVNIDAIDDGGNTVFVLAEMAGHQKVMDLLEQSDEDENEESTDQGSTEDKAAQADDDLDSITVPPEEVIQSRVHKVLFSPDGQLLATESQDKEISLWNVQTGNLVKTFKGYGLVFSANGQLAAFAEDDKVVEIWNTMTGALVKAFKGHQDYVSKVIFSPDGQFLASASRDGTVRLWKADTLWRSSLAKHWSSPQTDRCGYICRPCQPREVPLGRTSDSLGEEVLIENVQFGMDGPENRRLGKEISWLWTRSRKPFLQMGRYWPLVIISENVKTKETSRILDGIPLGTITSSPDGQRPCQAIQRTSAHGNVETSYPIQQSNYTYSFLDQNPDSWAIGDNPWNVSKERFNDVGNSIPLCTLYNTMAMGECLLSRTDKYRPEGHVIFTKRGLDTTEYLYSNLPKSINQSPRLYAAEDGDLKLELDTELHPYSVNQIDHFSCETHNYADNNRGHDFIGCKAYHTPKHKLPYRTPYEFLETISPRIRGVNTLNATLPNRKQPAKRRTQPRKIYDIFNLFFQHSVPLRSCDLNLGSKNRGESRPGKIQTLALNAVWRLSVVPDNNTLYPDPRKKEPHTGAGILPS
ncbi:transcription initiation factor tfiid, putative [Talaromyces stipitatus ATCC 10500]|uniref:Transcription initiation factor tfiid, putative n=1 Tax=Talaromyces stipitatus (strain ATCC 10500 / CBS 375.48 / QM 6759 / NRRL 1006) TaxID=441959 RepID=B8ML02_TALSN|nr:transcription initiation factor tfiid, putative [Talaromyces stipitatus ATCC 10500]EED15418.1 transcription initiation factor tfiid, putative [Talaromyces stipitatus ATCC 10500]